MFNNQHQIALGIIEGITEAFEAEFPGIEVDYQSIGKDYESMMKVKMASNDLPDVFSTHGWAVMRYGEYTYDLSGRDWAGKVKDSIRDIITDDKGALCALPMDLDITGMTYNKGLFDSYGLDVPRNFDELLEVCAQIVKKSNGTIVSSPLRRRRFLAHRRLLRFQFHRLLCQRSRSRLQGGIPGRFLRLEFVR